MSLVAVSWLVAAATAAGAPTPIVECRVPDDASGRVYRVVDRGSEVQPRWILTLEAKRFGTRVVELPLADAVVDRTGGGFSMASRSANGGLAVTVGASGDESLLDVFVNFELEVNVWRDLSPDVEHMNTDGPLAHARCRTLAADPIGQSSSAAEADTLLPKNTSEWMFTAGAARGMAVFGSEGGHRFGLQTISWGRVLTGSHLRGALRGQFTWAFEVVPVFGQYEPTGAYGFGLSPIVWRWNFQPRGRVAPYAELAAGGLWTTEPVPDRLTTANFTAHVAAGLRLFVRPHQALVVTYWFHHISNGNRLDRNPGVNSHVVQVGFSYVRRRM